MDYSELSEAERSLMWLLFDFAFWSGSGQPHQIATDDPALIDFLEAVYADWLGRTEVTHLQAPQWLRELQRGDDAPER